MRISVIRVIFAVLVICSTVTPSSAVEKKASWPTSYNDVDLSALFYQEILVNLDQWSSRCDVCKRPFPWKKEMQRLYEKDKLVVLTSTQVMMVQPVSKFPNNKQVKFYTAYEPAENKSTA